MNKRKLFIFTIFLSSLFFICGCKMEYNPNNVKAYVITFSTEKGKTPEPIALAEGAVIQITHLPMILTDYFVLDGWYSGDEKIEPGYVIHKNLYLKAKWSFVHYDYVWTDTSKVEPYALNNFKIDGDYTKAEMKNGAHDNMRLSRKENGINYELTDVYGFETKIKCDINMNWAGMIWWNKTGYNTYYFEVHGDGKFQVRFHDYDNNKWTTVLNLKAESSHIKTNDFNTIKLNPTGDCNFEIYVNDNKVGIIKRNDLQIEPGPIGYYASAKSGKTGYAWFKLMGYKKIK